MSVGDFIAQGVAALNAGDCPQAYRMFLGVVRDGGAARHELATAWYNLGLLLERLERWGASCAALGRANELVPNSKEVLLGYGWHLHLSGRTVEAEGVLRRAIAADPGSAVAYVNLSHVLATLGRDEEGLPYALRAADLDPGNHLVRLGLAFGLFFAGRWEEGWRAFEARIPMKMPEVSQYPWPRWDGERVGRLFLRCEQGLGDTLMMMRYFLGVDMLAEHVVLHVQGPLVGLCREIWPEWEVGELLTAALPVDVDAYVLAMGLPLLVPAVEGAYVPGARLSFGGPVRRVGLAWAGDPKHANDGHRSMRLRDLLELTEISGIEFVSLQVGDRGKAEIDECYAGSLVRDMSGEIGDMRDSVRVMGELDLVICVDSAVGHLAGSMGIPCWLLVNQRGCDWRWGRSGETTQWYPRHRVWRRGLDEQWSDVVRRVKTELRRASAETMEMAA